MRQMSETGHTLDMRRHRNLTYAPATTTMYQPAILLAYQGRLVEAIHEAEDIEIRERGDMIGVEFRVVTTTRTVTFNGPFDDADF